MKEKEWEESAQCDNRSKASRKRAGRAYVLYIVHTSAYGASPVLVSRASRSAVASFSQLEADGKVTT